MAEAQSLGSLPPLHVPSSCLWEAVRQGPQRVRASAQAIKRHWPVVQSPLPCQQPWAPESICDFPWRSFFLPPSTLSPPLKTATANNFCIYLLSRVEGDGRWGRSSWAVGGDRVQAAICLAPSASHPAGKGWPRLVTWRGGPLVGRNSQCPAARRAGTVPAEAETLPCPLLSAGGSDEPLTISWGNWVRATRYSLGGCSVAPVSTKPRSWAWWGSWSPEHSARARAPWLLCRRPCKGLVLLRLAGCLHVRHEAV